MPINYDIEYPKLQKRIAELKDLAIRAYKQGWHDSHHGGKGWTSKDVEERVAELEELF